MSQSSVDLFNKLETSKILKEVNPPIIIADNLRTPENMGLVLRLAGNIGSPLTIFLSDNEMEFRRSKIKRTSSGASEIVNWKLIKSSEIYNHLPSNYELVALETNSEATDIFSFKFPEKTAIIIGNEVFGITQNIIKNVVHCVYIPVPGKISSLNVSHALSIALFKWLHQVST